MLHLKGKQKKGPLQTTVAIRRHPSPLTRPLLYALACTAAFHIGSLAVLRIATPPSPKETPQALITASADITPPDPTDAADIEQLLQFLGPPPLD